jgi:aspartyl-tRNA(Asn)/glutamyl-tRNA(Gln) amidotransferase subunit A
VFIKVRAERARAAADAMDAARKVGLSVGRYAGIPIALKDLFDIAGEPTPAGSKVLADAPPATANAPVVQRMLNAGFIAMGRVNMTEFAFSGLGINPHYGTPTSPWDRGAARIPGGSSSGTAVAVADGMAVAGLGTDTGGSCRVPAAFCGVAGYKPTARRVPITGVLPLAPSLDSVGPLASTVACCAAIDAILAGEPPVVPVAAPLAGLRLAVPENMVLDGMDQIVAATFDRALSVLSGAGAHIARVRFPSFEAAAAVNAKGYDPRIRVRIMRGEGFSAADYLDLAPARARIVAEFDTATRDFDCVVMPTVPIVAPRIVDLDDERDYNRINMLILRNTALGNFLDRCAISIPCHQPGDAPVGLMLMGETMGDARLFRIAAAVEAALD